MGRLLSHGAGVRQRGHGDVPSSGREGAVLSKEGVVLSSRRCAVGREGVILSRRRCAVGREGVVLSRRRCAVGREGVVLLRR